MFASAATETGLMAKVLCPAERGPHRVRDQEQGPGEVGKHDDIEVNGFSK